MYGLIKCILLSILVIYFFILTNTLNFQFITHKFTLWCLKLFSWNVIFCACKHFELFPRSYGDTWSDLSVHRLIMIVACTFKIWVVVYMYIFIDRFYRFMYYLFSTKPCIRTLWFFYYLYKGFKSLVFSTSTSLSS